ncbi:MAG TPA: T9SS type A sorting domain-containing protein [bacterium]
MLGSQAITIEWHWQGGESDPTYWAVISEDGGDHWGSALALNLPPTFEFLDVAMTRGHLLVLANIDDLGELGTTSADRTGQTWSPFVALPSSWPGNTNTPFILGDSTSETAMVRQTVGRASMDEADLFVYRTTDGGQNWEPGRNLSEGHPYSRFLCHPELFCCGKLWGVVWEDFWNPDTTQWGVYYRMSANHGKDWYPAQPLGLDVGQLDYSGGQFIGDEVHVYWNAQSDYATAVGRMAVDTLAPGIEIGIPLPNDVGQGTTVQFMGSAMDNDSLVRMDVVLRRQGSADSLVVPLSERITSVDYRGTWTVPQDTTQWVYYYRAEDMWENVSAFPDTGAFTFHTTGWSATSSVTLPPLSFAVSVFPNPSNGWPSIKLAPGWFGHGVVRISVHDVLGRCLLEREVAGQGGQLISLMDNRNLEAASGVYLLRVTAGGRVRAVKVLVLK